MNEKKERKLKIGKILTESRRRLLRWTIATRWRSYKILKKMFHFVEQFIKISVNDKDLV